MSFRLGRSGCLHRISNSPTRKCMLLAEVSVTIFGEISILWHNFKNIGQIFEALFSTSLGYPALPGMIQNRY